MYSRFLDLKGNPFKDTRFRKLANDTRVKVFFYIATHLAFTSPRLLFRRSGALHFFYYYPPFVIFYTFTITIIDFV